MPLIGFLSGASAAPFAHLVAAFRQGLGDSGFVEGQNVAIEYRWAEGRPERLPEMANELVPPHKWQREIERYQRHEDDEADVRSRDEH